MLRLYCLLLLFHATYKFFSVYPCFPVSLEVQSLIPTLKKWHIKMMDSRSGFELNRKWHICLFLLGRHIRYPPKRSETRLSEDTRVSRRVCVYSVCVTVNLCFEISKSASCLSRKDIHSIFVSPTIPQRCYTSRPDALHSHSNQVCKVAQQRT